MTNRENEMRALYGNNPDAHRKASSAGGKATAKKRAEKEILAEVQEEKHLEGASKNEALTSMNADEVIEAQSRN